MKIIKYVGLLFVLLLIAGCVKTTVQAPEPDVITSTPITEPVQEPVESSQASGTTVVNEPEVIESVEPEEENIISASEEVVIDATGFQPRSVMINNGESVVFRNVDDENHRLNADGLFDSEELLPSRVYTYTFSMPGSFEIRDLETGKRMVVIVLE